MPQPANRDVSSSANGITIVTSESGFLRHELLFQGTAASGNAGQTVEIERAGRQTHWAWTLTAQATIQHDGSFSAAWHADHIGRFAIRAVILSGHHGAAAANASWPTVTVIVYRISLATQYGPGFYGHHTACGEVLHRQTLGVANRTLPCGTRVAVYYHGQMIVVPVIDRGPYAYGADWDLTEATAHTLGISGSAQIGAASLARSQ